MTRRFINPFNDHYTESYHLYCVHSKHIKVGNYRPTRETPFKMAFPWLADSYPRLIAAGVGCSPFSL